MQVVKKSPTKIRKIVGTLVSAGLIGLGFYVLSLFDPNVPVTSDQAREFMYLVATFIALGVFGLFITWVLPRFP